jgi:hypothetical protein
MNSAPEISAATKAPPRLRLACFEDYAQIHRLVTSYLQENQPPDDWHALWQNNPLWPRLGKDWPIGWVMEDLGGQVVGSMTNVPSLYRFRGRELICANGRDWVVAPKYRGFALWVMDEYFSQQGPDLFINTTVKETAMPAVSTFAARVPLGDWESTAYWVTGYRDFARRALEKVGLPAVGPLALPLAAALRLKDALFAKRLPAPPAGVEIEVCGCFDSRFDLFWEELVRQHPEKLLGARDSRTLSWHFARPLRRGRLWIFTASRQGLLRGYCIVKRQDLGEGLRRLRLVDYQTVEKDADLLPGLLEAALRRSAAEGFCVLEHLGCGLPKMRSFDRFAPYRRKLPAWPFYYHAPDAALAAELRVPEVWDPSVYDGDASYE